MRPLSSTPKDGGFCENEQQRDKRLRDMAEMVKNKDENSKDIVVLEACRD